jgi:hypothetical protein
MPDATRDPMDKWKIELDTLAKSPKSVPFYEAIGYRPRSIIFERRT